MAYRSAHSNLNLLAVGLGAYSVVALLSAAGFEHGVLSFFVALAVVVIYLRGSRGSRWCRGMATRWAWSVDAGWPAGSCGVGSSRW